MTVESVTCTVPATDIVHEAQWTLLRRRCLDELPHYGFPRAYHYWQGYLKDTAAWVRPVENQLTTMLLNDPFAERQS